MCVKLLHLNTTLPFYTSRASKARFQKFKRLDNAIIADQSTKEIINFCIKQAIYFAKDEKEVSWLKENMKLLDCGIPHVIIRYLKENTNDIDSETEIQISSIKSKLDKVGQLQILLENVREELDAKLTSLT